MSVNELYERALSGDSAERGYLITEEADEAIALAAMLAAAPAMVGLLPRSNKAASVTETDEAGTFEGTVPYGAAASSSSSPKPNELEIGDSRILFSVSGEQTHITQSLKTIEKKPNASAGSSGAPQFKGAIGVNEQGNVQGVDIQTSVVAFEIIKLVASNSVNNAFFSGVIAVMAAPVNANTFAHTDTDGRNIQLTAGTCLFLGMSNSPRSGGIDELRFSFAASANLADISIGDLTVSSKKGFEYLWVHYKTTEADNAIVQTPVAAYVEKIYNTGPFTALGL